MFFLNCDNRHYRKEHNLFLFKKSIKKLMVKNDDGLNNHANLRISVYKFDPEPAIILPLVHVTVF